MKQKPPDSPSTGQIIEAMVARIVEKFDPDRIILFGSHAKGLAGRDSDVDLLVVMPLSQSKRETEVAIRVVVSGMGLPKDVVVATPDELERYGRYVGTILFTALREGRVLYERGA